MTDLLPYPPELRAVGTADAPFVATVPVADLPPGAMRRVTFGDLDVLLAHTSLGIVAVDDRCPHMAAPLSIGELDGCIVACPLHRGTFDLETGDPATMPTTGGLWPDGTYEPVWCPPGQEPKADPPGKKTDARRLTRIRRLPLLPAADRRRRDRGRRPGLRPRLAAASPARRVPGQRSPGEHWTPTWRQMLTR